MISTQDRRDAVTLIDEAMESGARLLRACAELSISPRTYRRWTVLDGAVKADGRPMADRPLPANALSEEERQKLIAISCQPEFSSLPPSQIVPILADRGEYYASESSFYRVLKAHDLQYHRGRAAPPSPGEPKRHPATGPNQVWSTDISAPCRHGWRNPNHAGWLPTGSCNAALLGRDAEQKGAAKFCRVLTVGCHKQSSLNCTGREPFFTGRATAAFMVRQRSMRRKPLYLVKQPRQRNGVEAHGATQPVLMLPVARCGYSHLTMGEISLAIVQSHQG